jgi:hypothetical protein
MRCKATTAKGYQCKAHGFGSWPMCVAHIRAAYKELIHCTWPAQAELRVIKAPVIYEEVEE